MDISPSMVHPLKQIKGVCLFQCCENDGIEKMEVRDDDVWVLSFPRSGTTVTQEIVYLLKSNLDFDTARTKHLDERFPFLDMYVPHMPFFKGVTYAEKLPSPRLLKSHLHYHLLPEQLFKSNCKKVYVMRNPKDAFVSHIMLTKYFKQVDPDVDIGELLDSYLDGQMYSTPWWLHVHDFLINRGDPNLLIITYEEVVKNMPSTIRQIANHLSVEVTNDQVSQIADYCSFNNMKASKTSDSSWQEDFRIFNKQFGGHIRRGKVGGWTDYFTPEMNAKMDRMVQEKLGHLGIKFDYGT